MREDDYGVKLNKQICLKLFVPYSLKMMQTSYPDSSKS